MATPGVMLRFRDVDVSSVEEHNRIFGSKGRVLWGLWLKSFENAPEILDRLTAKRVDRIYIANTSRKSNPEIFVCDVKRIISDIADVDDALVPEYYQERKAEIPIWFELTSRIAEIHADKQLKALLGVPTIYFLDYDKNNNVINSAPQRQYKLKARDGARWALHLSDIHLGDDHAFRYPVKKGKSDTSPRRALSEVLYEDLKGLNVLGQIGCVIISGDILTKGAWSNPHEFGDRKLSGLDVAKTFLDDLSNTISVDPKLFCIVPGNHDIVRKASEPPQVQEALLHYSHEEGFRTLREEFCGVYKLSPLNYVARVEYGNGTLLLGMLNSAYLNEQTEFAEYGYVGDDADAIFDILERETSERVTKIVVLHHHLLPVYEREVVATNGKISMTLDAARLLRRAQEAGVSVVLHGHQHSTKRMVFSAASAEMSKESRAANRSVTIIAAGSSGAKRERLPVDETNAYALLDMDSGNPIVRMRRIFSDGRKAEDW